MTDAEDTGADAEGEDYGPLPVAVALIAEGMTLDQVQAERALRHMVESGSVRARDHTVSETRCISSETGMVRIPEIRHVWGQGRYSLADVRREIRKAGIHEGDGEQQPAIEQIAQAAEKSPGRPLEEWRVEIIAAATYHVIDLDYPPKQAEVVKFIMDRAAVLDRSISPTRAKEYAAAILRAHKVWSGRK
jgi:hypothetical protein